MQKPLRERIAPYLEDLKERKRTDAEVAKLLGVSVGYLNTVFNSMTKRSRGKVVVEREQQAALVDARRAMRVREAKKVMKGSKTLEKAAKAANCSERTMRRYVEQIAPKEPVQAYE